MTATQLLQQFALFGSLSFLTACFTCEHASTAKACMWASIVLVLCLIGAAETLIFYNLTDKVW